MLKVKVRTFSHPYVLFSQKLCKEDDSLEPVLETVIVLRQMLESATDAPPPSETEPVLPAPETLAAQFNNRYAHLDECKSMIHQGLA